MTKGDTNFIGIHKPFYPDAIDYNNYSKKGTFGTIGQKKKKIEIFLYFWEKISALGTNSIEGTKETKVSVTL